MAVDESHAIGARIAAQHAGLAQRQRLQLRQEFALDEVRHRGQPLRLGVEGGMNVEAGASAGAGRAAIAPASGWHRRCRLPAIGRRPAVSALRATLRSPAAGRALNAPRASSTDAMTPMRRNSARSVGAVDDHVGDQPGKVDVVGADRQQHQIELAIRLPAFRGGEGLAQFGQLSVDGAAARGRRFRSAGNRGARCAPNSPSAMVAPVQASGR